MTDISTEEKIKQAAKEVFISKGFEGCSSREIAKAAGYKVIDEKRESRVVLLMKKDTINEGVRE